MPRMAILAVIVLLAGCRDEPDRQSAPTEPSLEVVPVDTAVSSVCRAYLRELRAVEAVKDSAEPGPAPTRGMDEPLARTARAQSLQLKIATLDEVMSDACR